jgi:hypothetical protein
MAVARALLDSASKLAVIALALALGAVLFMTSTPVSADHQPANKVAASGSVGEVDFIEDGDRELLLTQRLRTSKPTELLINVSAECSIITDVVNFGSEVSEARGALKLYLESENESTGETRRIGVTQASTGPNESEDGADSEVVFCDRLHRQTTAFHGDDEDHEIEQYLETRSANAFNWLALNMGSAVHTVRLYAVYESYNTAGSMAKGAIGSRTMIIEPVRAKNDEHVEEISVN